MKTKNPNGYGCIKKLSGHRRRPYIFVVTEAGRQRVVGAFPNQIEALIFQTDYNRSHGLPRLSDNKLTFAELYHRWLPAHIEHASPSMSTLAGYRAAYLLYRSPKLRSLFLFQVEEEHTV